MDLENTNLIEECSECNNLWSYNPKFQEMVRNIGIINYSFDRVCNSNNIRRTVPYAGGLAGWRAAAAGGARRPSRPCPPETCCWARRFRSASRKKVAGRLVLSVEAQARPAPRLKLVLEIISHYIIRIHFKVI